MLTNLHAPRATSRTAGGGRGPGDVPVLDRQRALQRQADASPHVAQLSRLASRARYPQSPKIPPVQAVLGGAVIQMERTVSNRMRDNMKASLARVFGTNADRYEIDQESGSTFSDNNAGEHGRTRSTTGHHGVKVTDTVTDTVYYCDFHQDGAYYTRG